MSAETIEYEVADIPEPVENIAADITEVLIDANIGTDFFITNISVEWYLFMNNYLEEGEKNYMRLSEATALRCWFDVVARFLNCSAEGYGLSVLFERDGVHGLHCGDERIIFADLEKDFPGIIKRFYQVISEIKSFNMCAKNIDALFRQRQKNGWIRTHLLNAIQRTP